MFKSRNPINELKIQASLLMKNLKNPQDEVVQSSIKRCKLYPGFSQLSASQLIIQCQSLKRKTALNIVAFEHGWENWNALLKQYDTRWYPNGSPFTLNWFGNYQHAKTCQKSIKGYLLPYRNQFFVCDKYYIEWLGLDPLDENWTRIHYDAAFVSNELALSQLTAKLKRLKLAKS